VQDALQDYVQRNAADSDNQLGTFEILEQNGSPVTYRSYLEWIAAIRTRFEVGQYIAVRLNINNAQSPWIRVQTNNFYITAFSQAQNPWANGAWREIPPNQINYPENSIGVTLETIRNAMFRVRDWTRDPGNGLQDGPLVILIFIIAEAARFDGVAFAVNALLRGQVGSFDWLDFRGLLTNWSFISLSMYRQTLQPGVSLFISRAFAGSPLRGNANLLNILEQLARLDYPLGYNPSRQSSS
jgi:hypothetical protein